jgi:hypothetical protein
LKVAFTIVSQIIFAIISLVKGFGDKIDEDQHSLYKIENFQTCELFGRHALKIVAGNSKLFKAHRKKSRLIDMELFY